MLGLNDFRKKVENSKQRIRDPQCTAVMAAAVAMPQKNKRFLLSDLGVTCCSKAEKDSNSCRVSLRSCTQHKFNCNFCRSQHTEIICERVAGMAVIPQNIPSCSATAT